MFFEKFEGWKIVENEQGQKRVLAAFVKADRQTSFYNAGALKRMRDKPSGSMTGEDKKMVGHALSEGPHFFKAFDGIANYGRGGKSILVAKFHDAVSNQSRTYGQKNLKAMQEKPPKGFSPYDGLVLQLALDSFPR